MIASSLIDWLFFACQSANKHFKASINPRMCKSRGRGGCHPVNRKIYSKGLNLIVAVHLSVAENSILCVWVCTSNLKFHVGLVNCILCYTLGTVAWLTVASYTISNHFFIFFGTASCSFPCGKLWVCFREAFWCFVHQLHRFSPLNWTRSHVLAFQMKTLDWFAYDDNVWFCLGKVLSLSHCLLRWPIRERISN